MNPVALILVSHSARLAEGVAELLAQMAPDVPIIAAGGDDDGGLGTSFDRITAAVTGLSDAGGIVLYDLGSALLTTETALEFLDEDEASRIEIVDAPLVEGALAAAVVAQGGASRAEVAAAARSASGTAASRPPEPAAGPGPAAATRSFELRNPLGLHARPVAELIRALADLDATVTLARSPAGEPVDARSLLSVVRLGLRPGDSVLATADGPDADRALARLGDLVASGFGELTPAPSDANPATGIASNANQTGGSPGQAAGRLRRVAVTEVPDRRADDPVAEQRRLARALLAARHRLDQGDPLARAHGALLADPGLSGQAEQEIDQGWAAETAWWQAIEAESIATAQHSDPVVAARAIDVRDAGAAVLTELGVQTDRVPADAHGLILVADELGPSEVTEFSSRGGAGIVLTHGTSTAHAVVVAKGLGLPLVLARSTVDGRRLDEVPDGTLIGIDGGTGRIEVDPVGTTAALTAIGGDPAPVEVAGRRVVVAANIGSLAEAQKAVAYGADGIGLLRTELLMLDRPELPDEQSQVAELTEILAVLGDRPVVIRVLDAGGDKPVRALRLSPQQNGFLGVRGLRWLLANPEVLHTQLRAIARASVGHQVSVMAPMVTRPSEATAFRSAVENALQSLTDDDLAFARPAQVGVMVEVPAAALTADEIGAEVDFLSIGTNDLVAYTMAADRTNPALAVLLEPDSTAIRRLLAQVCERAGVPVHVCGELAADPDYALWLVAQGVTELSMAAPRIPELKQRLRDQRGR